MKYTILALLLITSAAYAKKEKQIDYVEKLTSVSRTLYRDLTELQNNVSKCAENEVETKAQIEGLVFGVTNVRNTMACQYDESACKEGATDLARAEADMKDLNVKVNGVVFGNLKRQFGQTEGCQPYLKTLANVELKMKEFSAAFNLARDKRPAVPAR